MNNCHATQLVTCLLKCVGLKHRQTDFATEPVDRMLILHLRLVSFVLLAACVLCNSFEASTCDECSASFLQLDIETSARSGVIANQNAEDVKTREDAAEYYWPARARDLRRSSFAPYNATTNFTSGPTWVWDNPLAEKVKFSPLIDNDKNIYVLTTGRIRKFTQNGELLWTWQSSESDGTFNNSAYLYKGSIFAIAVNKSNAHPTILSLSMSSGTLNWKKYFDNVVQHRDSSSLSVLDDIILFPVKSMPDAQGNGMVFAANVADGSYLWNYSYDDVVWNFSPASPGDKTLLFSGGCGAAYRISLTGQLIWRKGPSNPGQMCVPAGGTLGPNGIFYAEYSNVNDAADGRVTAYRVDDGSVVWERKLGRRAAQYPAVGRLGENGPLAVVVTVGDNPDDPTPVKPWMDKLSVMLRGPMTNGIKALDAETGEELWHWEEPAWRSWLGAGEVEMINKERSSWPPEDRCWPDAQGIPVILADGTVIASSSHGGGLYSLNDFNKDGKVDASEVSTFETNYCFLNSPSVAPGMLVAAPCWGPMYVFKAS
eukprot:TRINITY_DN4040_c0_g1_i1.p1 TRINITY_DN4040_c0_g1~~TRINITY_DN4040_c0_g1_i1.p1  ORF type:complete len:541 (-),score=84.75 TRINITY_DN4040_c0_g1_i1:200-1822(-)